MPLTNNPFVAESLAIFIAIQLCKDAGIHKIILKGDVLQVVNLMKLKAQDWSEGGMLVQDALYLINLFATWSIQHVKRECNNVAHCLAKATLLCDANVIDLEIICHCIVAKTQSYDLLMKLIVFLQNKKLRCTVSLYLNILVDFLLNIFKFLLLFYSTNFMLYILSVFQFL